MNSSLVFCCGSTCRLMQSDSGILLAAELYKTRQLISQDTNKLYWFHALLLVMLDFKVLYTV